MSDVAWFLKQLVQVQDANKKELHSINKELHSLTKVLTKMLDVKESQKVLQEKYEKIERRLNQLEFSPPLLNGGREYQQILKEEKKDGLLA